MGGLRSSFFNGINTSAEVFLIVDTNKNGIIDSHEKWFLVAKVLVLVWSLGFLSASYMGLLKNIDRTFLATTLTASAASLGMKRPK